MGQARSDADFPEKAIHTQLMAHLGAEHLQRDRAFVLQVVGEEDQGRATGVDPALDAVPVTQCAGESFTEVGHVDPGSGSEPERAPAPTYRRELRMGRS